MTYFKQIMEKDYPELETSTVDPSVVTEKEKENTNLLLGTVCQASYRLLQKFGNKKVYWRKPDFAMYYVEKLAQPAMEAHLYLISKKDKFVGRKPLYFSLRFIELFIQNKDTCKLMEPHMETLLTEYMIPLLSINVQDAVEFQENTSESIRKELSDDPLQSDNCPKIAARGLLVELCKYKSDSSQQKPELLNKFLHLQVDHLNEYMKNPGDVDFRVKDGALFALYSIAEIIGEHDDLLNGLEPLLTEHVLCELSSENEFLKARALLCYNEITSKMDLEDSGATAEY